MHTRGMGLYAQPRRARDDAIANLQERHGDQARVRRLPRRTARSTRSAMGSTVASVITKSSSGAGARCRTPAVTLDGTRRDDGLGVAPSCSREGRYVDAGRGDTMAPSRRDDRLVGDQVVLGHDSGCCGLLDAFNETPRPLDLHCLMGWDGLACPS